MRELDNEIKTCKILLNSLIHQNESMAKAVNQIRYCYEGEEKRTIEIKD